MALSRSTGMQDQLVWPWPGRAGLAPQRARRSQAAGRRSAAIAWLTFVAIEGLLLLTIVSVVGGIQPAPSPDVKPQPRPAPSYERWFATVVGDPAGQADRAESLPPPGHLLPPQRPGS